MSRSRGWCFTINHPTDSDRSEIESLVKKCVYVITANEVGDSGTPHIQGYCYMTSAKVLSGMKKMLTRAHLEAQKGTPKQAIEYCKKDGDFQEYGSAPASQENKGKRGREFWDEQLALAKAGRVEECDSKLQITHDLALHRIAARYAPQLEELDISNNHHQWFYGETGTGKSRAARLQYPGAYLKACNKWWSNYNNEDNVLIEDFDKRHDMLGHFLKIWADRYPFSVETKGGEKVIRPKMIIITSNWHPSQIWQNEPQTLEPIERRFKITLFHKSLSQIRRAPPVYSKDFPTMEDVRIAYISGQDI